MTIEEVTDSNQSVAGKPETENQSALKVDLIKKRIGGLMVWSKRSLLDYLNKRSKEDYQVWDYIWHYSWKELFTSYWPTESLGDFNNKCFHLWSITNITEENWNCMIEVSWAQNAFTINSDHIFTEDEIRALMPILLQNSIAVTNWSAYILQYMLKEFKEALDLWITLEMYFEAMHQAAAMESGRVKRRI